MMIFENATILTMNADRQILEQGPAAISEDQVAAVGKRREII